MTDTVLIFSGSIDTPHYRWFAPGSGESQAGPAAAAAAVFDSAGPVTVLLGSAHVLLTDVQVTVRNRRLLANAVAYALEDRLADDVENLVFDVGPETAGTYPVAVCARALVDAVSEDLAASGFANVRCVPYVFAVPFFAGHATVLHDGTGGIARTGAFQGFTAADAAIPCLLARLDDAAEARDEIRHYAVADPETDPATPSDDGTLQTVATSTFHSWLANNLDENRVLQFKSAASGQQRPGSARRLAVAAVLLLAALAVHTAFNHAKTADNERRLAAVEQDTREVFARAFPDVRRIVNPRAQAERMLADLTAGHVQELGFLDGLHALGASIAGAGADTRIRSLRYQHGRFDVMLDTDGVATLERVRTTLAERRLQVDIVSADNRDGYVSGRLRIDQDSP